MNSPIFYLFLYFKQQNTPHTNIESASKSHQTEKSGPTKVQTPSQRMHVHHKQIWNCQHHQTTEGKNASAANRRAPQKSHSTHRERGSTHSQTRNHQHPGQPSSNYRANPSNNPPPGQHYRNSDTTIPPCICRDTSFILWLEASLTLWVLCSLSCI